MEVGKCCICFNIFAFHLTWEIWLCSTEANTFKGSGADSSLGGYTSFAFSFWGGLDFCPPMLSTFLVCHVDGGNSLPSLNESPGFPPSYLSSEPVQVQVREEAYCPNRALNLSALRKRLHTVGNI